MLSSIRKFSTSFLGKVVIALIAIAFVVGFGFSGSFSGKQNIVAEINDEKISTQEFVNYLRTVNITYEDMERVGKYNLLERVLTNYISEKIVAIESKKKGFNFSFGLLDQIESIKFEFIDFRLIFLILNRIFNCFSVCNFGSKPITIFFLNFNTSLGNLLGIVIILNLLPD